MKSELKKTRDAYFAQKSKAAARGIEWHFTFDEWLELWKSSGKFHLRGRGLGRYCMARHGDVGPYTLWNVSIVGWSTNAKDANLNRPQKTKAVGEARLGIGRGWTKTRSKTNPYSVHVAHKYVGCYSTVSEAEGAYRTACEAHQRVGAGSQ